MSKLKTRPTDGQRAYLWAEKRSAAKYASSLLDPEFDSGDSDPDAYERLVFGSFDGDMRGRPEKGGGMSRSMSARRKRRTVSTDDPEIVKLPDEPPPGWAEP